jgi:hypothetical protein
LIGRQAGQHSSVVEKPVNQASTSSQSCQRLIKLESATYLIVFVAGHNIRGWRARDSVLCASATPNLRKTTHSLERLLVSHLVCICTAYLYGLGRISGRSMIEAGTGKWNAGRRRIRPRSRVRNSCKLLAIVQYATWVGYSQILCK